VHDLRRDGRLDFLRGRSERRSFAAQDDAVRPPATNGHGGPSSAVAGTFCFARTRLLVALLAALVGSDASAAPAAPAEPARGKLLVARERLTDPNFRETVILLLEYAPDGALGVVINRPTDVPLATLLPDVTELTGRPDLAYVGGPVARDRMILLIRASSPPEASARVLDEVFITSSLDVLREMSRDTADARRFRAYVGYAGWGPRQLDDEIQRGDWSVTAGEPSSVFAKDPKKLWRELTERTSGQWVRAEDAWRAVARHHDTPPVTASQRSTGSVALPPPARKAWRAATLALTL